MWKAVWMKIAKLTILKYRINNDIMNNKIYLSGPISGLPYDEMKAAFSKAENAIRERYGALVDIVNPTKLVNIKSEWKDAMRVCISALMECNYIHMLPGSEKNEGARLEFTIASKLGFGVCNDQFDLVNYGK